MSPWNRRLYPANWAELRRLVLERSQGRCECEGECGRHEGRCERRQGDPLAAWRVVLTVAHLWRGPCAECHAAGRKCGEPEHVKAMCQRCHLIYDLPHHVANARHTRHDKKASGDLFAAHPLTGGPVSTARESHRDSRRTARDQGSPATRPPDVHP